MKTIIGNMKTKEESSTQTFLSSGGADILVSMDGRFIGELQDLNWEEDFFSEDEYSITGSTTFIVFDSDISISELAKNKKHFDIEITYADEYGNSLHYRIYDCLLTRRTGTHDIDGICISEKYFYKAKRIEKLTQKEFQEQLILQD